MKFIAHYFERPLQLFMLAGICAQLLSGCGKEEKAPGPDTDTLKLVSATQIVQYNSAQLKSVATLAGFGDAAAAVEYDVRFLKVVYKTHYQGQVLNASGLLAIPLGTPKPPSLLSAQHGTNFLKASAPSNFPASASFSGLELLAGAGFITVIPDYIGYGASAGVSHPYYDQAAAAAAVVDLLKATMEYLGASAQSHGSSLFLLGYSEGGYVTLAAQRAIEAADISGLNLQASAAGAGGYDLQAMLDGVIKSSVYPEPGYLAFLLDSYNKNNHWNRPLSDFFREPYAGRIMGLLDGTKGNETINGQLSNSPSELFTDTFYTGLQTEGQEAKLKQALALNSFQDWAPKRPTRLYHGTADKVVFFANSQSTYAAFKANGAQQVDLIPIPGGDHGSSSTPMVLASLSWFQTLDK